MILILSRYHTSSGFREKLISFVYFYTRVLYKGTTNDQPAVSSGLMCIPYCSQPNFMFNPIFSLPSVRIVVTPPPRPPWRPPPGIVQPPPPPWQPTDPVRIRLYDSLVIKVSLECCPYLGKLSCSPPEATSAI